MPTDSFDSVRMHLRFSGATQPSLSLTRTLCCLGLGTLLAACNPRESEQPITLAAEQPPADISEHFEGQLRILAWPGYLERGDTDPAFDWVNPFERETGCEVQSTTASTSDEMVALVSDGGFDLVTASGDVSQRLIEAGRVEALDLYRIPSFANIDERLREAPRHFVDGRHYGVPFLWSRNLLAYRTDILARAPRSWSVLYRSQKLGDGDSNWRRAQAYAGAMSVADAALYLMKQKPTLAITSPYQLNEEQYAEVVQLLRRRHGFLAGYWDDIGTQVQGFTSGGVVVANAWPFQVKRLRQAGQPVDGTVPVEGTTGRADATMLLAGAKHPACAYRWMEWSLNLTVQGDAAAWTGSVPVVPEACDDNALLGRSGCALNGADEFEHIWFWRMPEESCGDAPCVTYARWASDYSAIVNGH